MYTTLQAAQALSTTRETARKWCVEFAQYLSSTANPGTGRDRALTDEDMRVLALVREYKATGRTFEDIHAALKAGQRGTPPEVNIVEATSQRHRLLELEQDVARLQGALHEALQSNQQQAGQITLLRQQLKEAQDKADTLLKEIAVLRFRLDKE